MTASVVKGLVKAGALLEEDAPRDLPYPRLDPDRPGVALAGDQVAAADALVASVAMGGYRRTLLKGVTGSGKTEVYLEAVAEMPSRRAAGAGAVAGDRADGGVSDRVEARFGARPAEWHSGVTMTERRRVWRMVAEGGGAAGGRRALGAVPAVPRSGADRRR